MHNNLVHIICVYRELTTRAAIYKLFEFTTAGVWAWKCHIRLEHQNNKTILWVSLSGILLERILLKLYIYFERDIEICLPSSID